MAKGKAQTEELNQMSERGVPILEALVELAASYGNEISKEDVYKAAEKGQITFKAIEEALKLMTAEGGIFNEQMERQSQTMDGWPRPSKTTVFLVFAELGEQIEKTFNIKEKMRAFIGWLQNLTAELKKPREEQEGFARALTEGLLGLKAFFWARFLTPSSIRLRRSSAWKGFKDRFLSNSADMTCRMEGAIESITGGSGNLNGCIRCGRIRLHGRRRRGTVSVSRRRHRPDRRKKQVEGLGGRGGRAAVTVDFRNLPRGTRTETRADSDTDLEVITGYAMQGAH